MRPWPGGRLRRSSGIHAGIRPAPGGSRAGGGTGARSAGSGPDRRPRPGPRGNGRLRRHRGPRAPGRIHGDAIRAACPGSGAVRPCRVSRRPGARPSGFAAGTPGRCVAVRPTRGPAWCHAHRRRLRRWPSSRASRAVPGTLQARRPGAWSVAAPSLRRPGKDGWLWLPARAIRCRHASTGSIIRASRGRATAAGRPGKHAGIHAGGRGAARSCGRGASCPGGRRPGIPPGPDSRRPSWRPPSAHRGR